MRESKRVVWLVVLGAAGMSLAWPTNARPDEVPWKERYQLGISPWYGTPGDAERYARAEVLWTSKWAFVDPNCPGSSAMQCDLEVLPFHTHTGGEGGDALCPATTPFYRQPTPTHHCSGTLVAEDLILTAGHCIGALPDPEDCTDQRILFDYAVQGPGDELGDPVPFPSGTVSIPQEDICSCIEVVGWESPFPPGTDPDDAFASGPLGIADDWGLLRMDCEASGLERIPVPIERFTETAVGDFALLLGHPARIPMKAEIQQVTHVGNNRVTGPFNVLGGNSGSGMINLGTGKLVGDVTCCEMSVIETTEPLCMLQPETLHDLIFDGPLGSGRAQPASVFKNLVPVQGLQVTPYASVDHYGPPTSADDFPWKDFTLSVSTDSLPVAWSVSQDGTQPQVLDIEGGVSSGTLDPGEQTTVRLRPLDWVTELPGVYPAMEPFYDGSYFTRNPVLHRVHVGVDGFGLLPTTPMAGEGPGVLTPPGGTKRYTVTNRWSVDQTVTVHTDERWILVNGLPGPVDVTIELDPGQSQKVTIVVDASAESLHPQVHKSEVTLSSEESGVSEPLESRDVWMDLCRQIYVAAPPTIVIEDLQPDATASVPITVVPPAGHTLEDVDVAVFLTHAGGGQPRVLDVKLAHDADEVDLAGPVSSLAGIFDDDSLVPTEPLSQLNDDSAAGTWELRIKNGASEPVDVTITRLEVRLHTNESPNGPPCVF